MVSFLLNTLALPVLPRTRSHCAGFTLEMVEERKKICRKSTSLPCFEDLSMFILGRMSIAIMAEPHLVCD